MRKVSNTNLGDSNGSYLLGYKNLHLAANKLSCSSKEAHLVAQKIVRLRTEVNDLIVGNHTYRGPTC